MNTLKLGGRMKVEDEYIQELKFLHQIKRYKNVDFHKFRLKEKGIWHTYWYLDNDSYIKGSMGIICFIYNCILFSFVFHILVSSHGTKSHSCKSKRNLG